MEAREEGRLMEPLIVDPNDYDKGRELSRALGVTKAFLELNGIAPVTEYLWEPDDGKKPIGNNPWHDKGWYWFGRLFVNLKRSRVPVKVPGFSWSFTGSKADLTAPGVLAHETGHHVHFQLDRRGTSGSHALLCDIRDVKAAEAPVSGYEPNLHETFAEAMRLFVLNPSLLEEGRPLRWKLLTEGLGLRPLHGVPWREVLRNAHPRLIGSLENWVER